MKEIDLKSFIDYLDLVVNHPKDAETHNRLVKGGIQITVGDLSTRLPLNEITFNALRDELLKSIEE